MPTKEKIILCVSIIFLGTSNAWLAQAKHANGLAIPTLTVCEALSNASQYDGKLVRIRGKVVSTDEAAAFIGEDCTGVFVTDGKVWPNAIAWTSPDDSPLIVHPVDFKYNWGTDKLLDTKYRRLRKHLSAACIEFTYTGMFEAWSLKNSKKKDSKGTPYEIPGFGHLNAAGAQLVLKSADDVTPIPNCKTKK